MRLAACDRDSGECDGLEAERVRWCKDGENRFKSSALVWCRWERMETVIEIDGWAVWRLMSKQHNG